MTIKRRTVLRGEFHAVRLGSVSPFGGRHRLTISRRPSAVAVMD